MQPSQIQPSHMQPSQSSRGIPLGLHLILSLAVAVVAVIGQPIRTLAHGVRIESEPIQSLHMRALFESGNPMANAQVTIYSPVNPETPWQQLSTDEDGYFVFTPDPAIPGNWDIQVRQAGHGDLVRVTVDGDSNSHLLPDVGLATPPDQQSLAQKWVTIAAAVWGFVGTALFFSQRQLGQSVSANPTTSAQDPASDPSSTINK